MTKEKPGTVSVKVAHKAMGEGSISLRALYRACASGEIPTIRVGGRWLIPRIWLDAKLNGK